MGERFTTTFRCKWLCDGAETIEGMAESLEKAARQLRDMARAGVTLEGEVSDDYATLVTGDADVAEQFGFEAEQGEGEGDPDNEEWDGGE